MAFIQSFKDLLFKVSDDTIVVQEEMDLLSWNLSKKDEEVQQVISNIKNLNDRYVQEKEVHLWSNLANWQRIDRCPRGIGWNGKTNPTAQNGLQLYPNYFTA